MVCYITKFLVSYQASSRRLVHKMAKASATNQPFVKLNSGRQMPLMGIGTLMSTVPPDDAVVEKMVLTALEVGYRHIDTAQIYRSERGVGLAVNKFIAEGKATRDEIFVTTKLWRNAARRDDVIPSMKKSLERLNLDYVDLFLVHWPTAFTRGEEMWPKDANGKLIYGEEFDYVDTWKGMEEVSDLGLAKSIGVSNFNSKQLQRLLDNSRIPPANHQIETHPWLTNTKLIKFCHDKGISVVGYANLFGFNDRRRVEHGWPTLYTNETLLRIAKKHNCTAGQVALKYQIVRNVSVIPKSEKKDRIVENFEALNVQLSDEDMEDINALNKNIRLNDEYPDHKYYPFGEEF